MISARICLLIIVLPPSSLVLAQKVERPQDAWLERAQNITNDSLKDVKSLEALDGAMVLAQLAVQWWNVDTGKARKWLVQAVEAVELEPARENSAERRKRLFVARSLLAIISTTDQKLWERLQAVLASGEAPSSEAEQTASADAMIQAALSVLKTDPRRAAAMGSAALRIGLPNSIQQLLWGLRGREPKLADQLFGEALVVARRTPSEDFLNSLRYAAFPELMGPGYDSDPPPDVIRAKMLLILADYLQQQTTLLASNGIRDCGLAPSLVERLQNQFDKLQPQRADLVRQIVRTCQEGKSQSRTASPGEPASSDTPDTVDSLLAQADHTNDTKIKRPTYLAQAARLAAHEKHFELAIKILESMSEEERKFIGVWDNWRRDWAVALAIEFLKRDDVNGMLQVMKAVPDGLRPFAMISFVDKLTPNASIEIAQQFLDESRKDLGDSQKPDLEKAYWYLTVARLYSKCHLESAAVDAFKEAVRSLNPAKSDGATDSGNLVELNTKIIQADFPTSLLESREYIIKEAVSSITSVTRRTRVRLDLLQISIKQYRVLAAKFATEPKTQSNTK